jgi:hypothetical protein
MTERGHDKTDAIHRELRCPQCEYSLRGLPGESVTCPECGLHCDVARLIASRWTGPWWEAPGYNRLVWPVAWAVIVSAGWLIAGGILSAPRYDAKAILIALALVFGVPLIWLGLLWNAYRFFADGRGLLLALLAHALFAGYVAATIGIAVSIGQLLWWFDIARIIAAAIFVPLLVALFWLCRRGERYIAQQCIRKYIAEQSAPLRDDQWRGRKRRPAPLPAQLAQRDPADDTIPP